MAHAHSTALSQSKSDVLGSVAPDFSLVGVDGQTYSLQDAAQAKALVVVFMCNHCPYVKAVIGRLQQLAKEYAPRGVQLVAINSNDADRYPQDDFPAMQALAQVEGFVFPYLWDASQEVARAYDAQCTPDFYAYAPGGDATWILKYQGRLDDSWKDAEKVTRRELAQALDQILLGKNPEVEQHPALGCSIKWKV